MTDKKYLTKTEIAKTLGVARSSLYYKHKRPLVDEEVKSQIESVLVDNPAYGHKRIAIDLKLNKKRILRVMKKFGIKPARRRARKPRKKEDEGKEPSKYQNLIKDLVIDHKGQVWASDFTYINYRNKFIYLATIIDLFDREIVGVNISRFHNKELVLGAFNEAIKEHRPPEILHSDQGTEYESDGYTNTVESLGTKISMSAKGSPWENGFQESFYSQFKLELGDSNRFDQLGELIEQIYTNMAYYNNKRIHSAHGMSIKEFKEKKINKKT